MDLKLGTAMPEAGGAILARRDPWHWAHPAGGVGSARIAAHGARWNGMGGQPGLANRNRFVDAFLNTGN